MLSQQATCISTITCICTWHGARVCVLPPQVDAGVDKELVFGDPTAPRFVFWQNKLRATPSGPDVLTFDLLSIWGKIRAGLGAIGLVNGQMPGEGGNSVTRVSAHSQCKTLCMLEQTILNSVVSGITGFWAEMRYTHYASSTQRLQARSWLS